MSEPSAKSNVLLEALEDLDAKSQELRGAVARVTQFLASKGVRLPIDLDGLIRSSARSHEIVKKHAASTVEQLNDLQDLVRQSARITSSLELKNVLEHVMDTIIELTGAQRVYLMLRDTDNDELQVRAARNWNGEDADVAYSRSVVDLTLKEGQPVITTNAQVDDRFQGAQSVIGRNLLSILCIPLTFQGHTVGVLYADSQMEQAIFKQSLVPLLSAFATQAALAIKNASAFEKARDDLKAAVKEVEALYIDVDRAKVEQKLSEITETDYFQRLKSTAERMRSRLNVEH
jgi:transcriptional regulator with GAF, ATPase, and Fis domain